MVHSTEACKADTFEHGCKIINVLQGIGPSALPNSDALYTQRVALGWVVSSLLGLAPWMNSVVSIQDGDLETL